MIEAIGVHRALHVHWHAVAQIDVALVSGAVADPQPARDLFAKQLLQQSGNRSLRQGSGRRGALFMRRRHHHFPEFWELWTVTATVSTVNLRIPRVKATQVVTPARYRWF